MKGIRNDKLLWVNKTKLESAIGGNHESPLHLSLSYCKNLDKLIDLLFSIPFEINKKTSMGLQADESVCIDCFNEGGFYSEHIDSGFGPNDTGKRITCMYIVN
jgi:hypothetical protein